MTIYKDDLERVYKLLRVKKRWTQHFMARTKRGTSTGAVSKHAACWCLIGAAEKSRVPVVEFMDVMEQLTRKDVAEWNDDKRRTHQQVKRLLDRAIKRAPARP